jgi:UDP-GlcNAc:undecaprenyl-phosphate GlcNAc-1-phosphate transferase
MIIFGFALGLIFSLVLTPAVRHLAGKWGVLDVPDLARKIHPRPTALMGGAAIFLSITLAALLSRDGLLGGFILPKHLIGILVGGALLAIGGALDDRFNLKPKYQIIFPVLAALAVIVSGIGIEVITNPWGGVLRLDQWKLALFQAGGVPYHLVLPADAIVFAWLMVMMYTTKLMDGLDGLVSGIAVIGFIVLALLSLTPEFGQPELARFGLVAAGAFGGFLFYNARPASIFLGEGGATLAGYLLGVTAIMSGAKIGITLLILAVPFLDLLWTVFRRVVLERRSFARADAGHLHFRLADLGFTPGQTVALYWCFAATFGGVGLFIRGSGKLLALASLAALFIAVTFLLRSVSRRNLKT